MFNLKVELVHPYAKMPQRNSENAAGYDLYAVEHQTMLPGLNKIPLGIKTEFTKGWAGFIYDRSSLGVKGFCRHAGLIDADYRGEWNIFLYNHLDKLITFEPSDRVAQVVFCKVAQKKAIQVTEVAESDRGTGGFGSTGR